MSNRLVPASAGSCGPASGGVSRDEGGLLPRSAAVAALWLACLTLWAGPLAAQSPAPTPEPIGQVATPEPAAPASEPEATPAEAAPKAEAAQVKLSDIVRDDEPSTAPLEAEAPPVLEVAATPSPDAPTVVATSPSEPSNAPQGYENLTFEERYLARIERSYDALRTVRGHFTQRFVSQLFMDEMVAPCDLYVRKPGGFHLAYGPPDGTLHWIYQQHYWQYDPEHEQVDKVALSPTGAGVESLNLMLLGFDLDAEEVFKVYQVSLESSETLEDGATSTTLRFVPIQSDLKLRYMLLSFVERAAPLESGGAPADGMILPRHIYYEEGFDADQIDQKEITFDKIELNVELDDALFVPEFPDDVDILTHE